MKERIEKEKSFILVAQAIAKRSTCLKKKESAILINAFDNSIISTGYNGCVSGEEECIEKEYCFKEKNNNSSCMAVDAIQNCLIRAGKNSYCADLYLYTENERGEIVYELPSFNCAKLIINAYISNVYIALPNCELKALSPEEIYEERLHDIVVI